MRAWLMDSHDGVEALRLGEVPGPKPGQAQVLLRIVLKTFLTDGISPLHTVGFYFDSVRM